MQNGSQRNIQAGILATLLGIPKSIALGLVAFAPLGTDYISFGPIAGLISLAAGNLAAVLRRGGSVIHNGPYSVSALMLAAAATVFVKTYNPQTAFGLVLVVVFVSGLIQLFMAALRLGTIAKYIPYPVFSGLMNGSAILILISQIKPIFGQQHLLLSIGTAIFTVIVYVIFSRYRQLKLPPMIAAVVFASVGFHIIIYLKAIDTDGLFVSTIARGLPEPQLILMQTNDLLSFQVWQQAGPSVLSFAVSIAVINSLSSFLAQGISDNLCKERTNPNAELMNQGITNLISAFFGGLSTAGSSSRTRAMGDFKATGRTARIAGGVFALVVLTGAGPILAPVPLSVMAAVLLVLAYSLIDRWLFSQITMLTNKEERKEAITNITISILVTLVMVGIGMVEAVIIGALLSVIIFVATMSRGIIQRESSGLTMRSNTERPRRENNILDRDGDQIRIIELEGYLYFGTADELLLRTDQFIQNNVRHIIIDFHHLKNIDVSGFMILNQVIERCENANLPLAIVAPSNHLSRTLQQRFQMTGLIYNYIDDALAFAEDLVIASSSEVSDDQLIGLAEVDILSDFTRSELDILEPYLDFQKHKHGSKILSHGQAGDSVFMIAGGRAELYTTTDGIYHCFYRLSQGTVFGEMAMIEGRPRSADVIAAGMLSCWVLTIDRLNQLKTKHPDLAYRLLSAVAALLSRRIRINLNIISQYRK